MQVQLKELKDICFNALHRLGYNIDHSETIFAEFLYGELTERLGHGFETFASKIEERSQSKVYAPKIEVKGYNIISIDGQQNLGQLVSNTAVELAVKLAREKEIGIVTVTNMHPYCMPGFYAKKIVDNDLVGIVTNNCEAMVSAPGKIEPVTGTNPIAIGFPTEDIPYIIDMATSESARGVVRDAKRNHTEIPEGIALDSEGNSTTNPFYVHSLIPFGRYKGFFGVNLVIDLLLTTLCKSPVSSEISNPLQRSYIFAAIDPTTSWKSVSAYKKRMSKILRNLKTDNKIDRYPHERAHQLYESKIKLGVIELDTNTIEKIKRIKTCSKKHEKVPTI